MSSALACGELVFGGAAGDNRAGRLRGRAQTAPNFGAPTVHWAARMKQSTEPSSQDYTTTDQSQYEPSTAAYTSYGETERSGDQSPYEKTDDDGYSYS